MPRVSKLNLPPLHPGAEPVGERLARVRKERGYTQIELADRIGIIQSLVSSYESGALKLSADMALRFAHALEVSVEEILEPGKKKAKSAAKPSRKVLRRLELIESLPNHQQQIVLKTIDAMLRGLKTAS